MAYAAQILAPRATLADRFQALKAEWLHRRAQIREENKVYRELAAMTDRELADLNIARVQIGDIARQAGQLV